MTIQVQCNLKVETKNKDKLFEETERETTIEDKIFEYIEVSKEIWY